ncbi:MAG: hypothetical protein ACON47_05885 [Flavobacteriaceae bacterium]
MKLPIRTLGWALIGLGLTLSVFELLLENSVLVLVTGLILFGISFLLKK